ncbi:TPA: hypothetical protein QFR36_000568 [Enterococcus faecium]|uniref:hypothetical protein n=1 Tax=Enterococcus TaxID=1350 RepID=UPI0002A228B8|nr:MULTISPECIES: hypothetical protein [Enterococcus]EGP4922510.1 hypothetical protein [Enterococcus faecium]ELB19865.1 hypothetical protein OIQ_03525 [Enterococcus faecium EnGen0025]MBT0736603.1 hypothetical protein [Enterococcus faecium]MBU9741680.1 hypothetical protein [Enterococcus faecium]MEB4618919.1 hypothetical protein [Enterococcus sp. E4-79]
MKKYIVNKRAIDNDELLQLIIESDGIYESTIQNLLQCNRTSLEARLKTLEKHKWISKRKLSKHFYYAKKFDLDNLNHLDLQANALQKMLTLGFKTSSVSITTNQQKQVKASFHSAVKKIYTHKNFSQKPQAFHLFQQCLSNENKELFSNFINYHHVEIPIQFSSIYDENQLIYTKSLDSLDIIAIPTMQQLPAIKKRLKNFSRYRVKNNTTFIRDDILIYIQSYDSFFFYTKNDQQQWNLYQIDSLFEFIFYLSNYFHSSKQLTFSNDKEEYKALETLYIKSSKNRKQYNTIAKKKAKKEAQS